MTIQEVKEKIAIMIKSYDESQTYSEKDLIDDLRRLYEELKDQ